MTCRKSCDALRRQSLYNWVEPGGVRSRLGGQVSIDPTGPHPAIVGLCQLGHKAAFQHQDQRKPKERRQQVVSLVTIDWNVVLKIFVQVPDDGLVDASSASQDCPGPHLWRPLHSCWFAPWQYKARYASPAGKTHWTTDSRTRSPNPWTLISRTLNLCTKTPRHEPSDPPDPQILNPEQRMHHSCMCVRMMYARCTYIYIHVHIHFSRIKQPMNKAILGIPWVKYRTESAKYKMQIMGDEYVRSRASQKTVESSVDHKRLPDDNENLQVWKLHKNVLSSDRELLSKHWDSHSSLY